MPGPPGAASPVRVGGRSGGELTDHAVPGPGPGRLAGASRRASPPEAEGRRPGEGPVVHGLARSRPRRRRASIGSRPAGLDGPGVGSTVRPAASPSRRPPVHGQAAPVGVEASSGPGSRKGRQRSAGSFDPGEEIPEGIGVAGPGRGPSSVHGCHSDGGGFQEDATASGGTPPGAPLLTRTSSRTPAYGIGPVPHRPPRPPAEARSSGGTRSRCASPFPAAIFAR